MKENQKNNFKLGLRKTNKSLDSLWKNTNMKKYEELIQQCVKEIDRKLWTGKSRSRCGD